LESKGETMKKLIAVFVLLASMFTLQAKAQTRILVGAGGSIAWDNKSAGASFGLEVPFLKHYELDLKDTFSPFETHVALGGGYANLASVGGHIWLTNSFGLNGKVERTNYIVTQVSKVADYAFGGVTYRTVALGVPSRFSFDYIGQFNNGVTPSGIETSHLQGLAFIIENRLGCAGPFCFRLDNQNSFGRVLTQGNPYCDGSIGPKTCGNRGTGFGGGFSGGIYIEFPRRKATENDKF
jgi:hypothetical protein